VIAVVDTCALCPRLCRHVCPVAVATGLESPTPSAIMTEVMLAEGPGSAQHEVAAALDLCTRCGHCEDFCGVGQPVVALLDAARTRHQARPNTWNAPAIQGHALAVAIICGPHDWSAALAQDTGTTLSQMLTSDHLGEIHRIRNDTAPEVISALKRSFQGRTAITSCGTCKAALIAAEVAVESIESVCQSVPPLPTWRTCHCEPGPSVDTLTRCCGARAPLATSESTLAASMATFIRRRLDGQSVYVPDTRCAAHLQSVGVSAVGPADHLTDPEH
jgi:ferredoxin